MKCLYGLSIMSQVDCYSELKAIVTYTKGFCKTIKKKKSNNETSASQHKGSFTFISPLSPRVTMILSLKVHVSFLVKMPY